jgi:formylglycine-generating enzyme required for sulfatase activity
MEIAIRILLLFSIFYAFLFSGCSRNAAAEEKKTFSLSISIEGKGNVTGAPLNSYVNKDSIVSLLAVADSGYSFMCWNGDLKSTANPKSFVVTKDITINCKFAKKPFGMQKIASANQSFTMGSSSAASALVERPPHQVKFTYDYFIDFFETTQGEYKQLMGANPTIDNASQGAVGIGDSLPVTYVRWYDAVLFCNAKSKRDGLDTVYTYSAKCSPLQTCPYVLENLAIHYDRLGYRLPTEAEWEYACRAGSIEDFYWGSSDASVDSFAWYFQNSQNRIRPPGQKKANGFGLFDMAGNVAEWVDDWRGVYSDSLCVDPIGPANLSLETFESSWERPIRGGCFSLGTSFLRSSSRSAPYAVTASAMNRYTGFRTAIGVLFPDTAARPSSPIADSATVNLSCLKSNIIGFIGTSRVKIVFAYTGGSGKHQVCFIDFSSPHLAVSTIEDSLPIYKPAISPNGAYVAYGSKGPGSSGSSMATIRLLDSTAQSSPPSAHCPSMFLPRWFVDTTFLDTFIIFTDGASMNNLALWETEKTYRQKFSAGSFSGSAEAVCDRGSFHGGMSRDGQFVATGYPQAFAYNTATSRITQYFIPPYSGRDDTAQVCNVSMTPSLDKPDEIMFLDFGYSKTSTIVGKPYGFHSIIYIANSNSKASHSIRNWFEVPAGYGSWNGVQWSNHPDFAIAFAQSIDSESISSLYLIDLKNSLYLKIATGEGLSDPCLWIDPKELSEHPDPFIDFAKYNVPSNSLSQYMLDIELKYFWAHRESIECVFVGSSQVMMNVDPALIKCLRTIQMGEPGMEFITAQLLIKNYILNLSPRLKVVGMSCDPGWIPIDYSAPDPHDLGFAFSKGLAFDKAQNFWTSGVPAAIEAKISAFNATSWPELVDSSGAQNNIPVGNGWGTPEYDGGDFAMSDATIQQYLALFRSLADSLAVHGVHFLLVKFPEHPDYKATGFVSRYGPGYATYNQLVAWYRELEKQNPYFHFYDANMNGNHDYTSAEALNCNHLNDFGRHKLSVRLDSVMTTFVH